MRELVLALLDYLKPYEKKLSPKQAHRRVFLAKFDFTMEYKPRCGNTMVDVLSEKMEFAAISQPTGSLLELIQDGLSHDPTAKSLIKLSNEGKTRRFLLDRELLYTHGHHLYVTYYAKLRKEVMKECHDSRWAGHLGMHCTLALLKDQYYWPHMGDDV
ncbi:reverse transcriptase [Gossypium australe]|uniref:Reverse transcriptase n=1 Tax=Gossypium australe TaxID=47621 RepID=A0A5B6WHE7_9ROSI|nr:reverse transcriptase [Gossypium australe]